MVLELDIKIAFAEKSGILEGRFFGSVFKP